MVSVPPTKLKMKSPLGTMLTLYLFTVIKDRRCPKLKWTFGSKNDGRNTNVFFFPEIGKADLTAVNNSEFIAELRLLGENFYLTSFFKLVSLAIPKSRF